MKIFNSEKELETRIVANKTVAIHVPYKISDDKVDEAVASIQSIAKGGCDSRIEKAIASLSDNPHPDLMYGMANLVSTVMNLNDDLFLPSETWKARSTPVNTPYNDQHIESDIIGHIIAARPLDSEGKVITGDEQPDYFDIEVDWVVYKTIFPAIAKEIAEKGPNGEKFVSMECIFKNFDYAIIEKDSKAKIVNRNEETSFLTKYLRAYGGPGQYKDYKIGRVLRDFRFSGMGSVDAPANPTSTIRNVEFASSANLEAITRENKVVLYIAKGTIMTIETLDQAKTVIADLEKKVSELETKAATVDALTTEKANLANELTTEKEKVTVATQKIETLEGEKKTVSDQLEQTKTELTTKAEALKKIEDEAKSNQRVSALKELGVEVDDAKRTAMASWSDEQFNSILEFTKSVSKTEDKNDVTDPNAVSDAQNKANKELEGAQANDKGGLENTPGDVETDDKKLEKAAAKLATALTSRKNRKSNVGQKKE